VNRWSLGACCALLLLVGAEPATRPSRVPGHEIGSGVIILGELGLPVGQETTVRGVKKSVGPLQEMFTVETIAGKAAPDGLRIQVDGIARWPDGTKATLRGNEVGTLRFVHLSETNFGPGDDRWKGPHQELFLSFHVSEVIAPHGLEVARER
jgi:hypothetical protein